MNQPTPDFVSKIASSSQMISNVEEHNAAGSAINLHPPDATHGLSMAAAIPTSSVVVSSGNDATSHMLNASPTTDPASLLLGVGTIGNLGSSVDAPSILGTDAKGLSSALEASSLNASSQTLEADPAVTDIGRTLVTAEELGFMDNLSHWMEERLGSSVVSQWGVAEGTKPLANLWTELAKGESSLEDSRPPKRTTNVVRVKITNDKGDVLVEAYQELSDGSRRERNRPLSEKMKPGEDAKAACLRGILEELGAELGASERVAMLPESYTKEEQERDSISYPGLPTRFVIHSMDAHIQHLPSTEFSTDESESDYDGGSAPNGDAKQLTAVGVKRHFWRWVPESDLAQLCSR